MRPKQRSMFVFQRARGPDGKEVDAGADVIASSMYWDESSAEEVRGDANANGTSILTLTIAANKSFICTICIASCNEAAFVKVGTGALADPPTDEFWIDVTPRGICGISNESNPAFVVAASTSAQTLRMWVPQTAYGAATNNSTDKYLNGFIGGYEV